MTPSLFRQFPLREGGARKPPRRGQNCAILVRISPGTRSRPDRGSASPDSFLALQGRKSLTLSRRKHYDFFGSMTPWQSE